MRIYRIEIIKIGNDYITKSYDSNNELLDTTNCGSDIKDVFANIEEYNKQNYF